MSQDWGLDELVLVELDAEAELVLPHKQQTITLLYIRGKRAYVDKAYDANYTIKATAQKMCI
jgi:hypothetical protein